jgi:hypothetical protein
LLLAICRRFAGTKKNPEIQKKLLTYAHMAQALINFAKRATLLPGNAFVFM